jgi:hypothetical protein
MVKYETVGDHLEAIKGQLAEAFADGEKNAPYGRQPDTTEFRRLLWEFCPSWMRETENIIAAAGQANDGPDMGWRNGRGYGLDVVVVIRKAAIDRFASDEFGFDPKYPLNEQLPWYWEFDLVWKLIGRAWACGPTGYQQMIFDEMIRLARETGYSPEED